MGADWRVEKALLVDRDGFAFQRSNRAIHRARKSGQRAVIVVQYGLPIDVSEPGESTRLFSGCPIAVLLFKRSDVGVEGPVKKQRLGHEVADVHAVEEESGGVECGRVGEAVGLLPANSFIREITSLIHLVGAQAGETCVHEASIYTGIAGISVGFAAAD